jgi:hypothetical protein
MSQSPLFDIYDPYGTLEQQSEYDIDPLTGRKRRRQIADLMPEEDQSSLMQQLASAGSSGLAGLGWILDTPGAMVRGTLSGGIGKGISALWDTSDERVDGRELLRQYGMVGDEDNWSNFGGGLAAEVLLDPTTYLSLGLNQLVGKGAKTAAGQAAARAGMLQDFGVQARNTFGMGERQALRSKNVNDLLEAMPSDASRAEALLKFKNAGGTDDMLTAPLAKMNRVSIPFMKDGATDLYGKAAGDWLAKAGDTLGEGLMTNPFTGRAARELERAFNPDVLGFVDRDRQWDAKTIMAARRARETSDRATLTKLQMDANEGLRKAGYSLAETEVSQAIRNLLEHGEDIPAVREMGGALNIPEVKQLTDWFANYRDTAMRNAEELGMPLQEFQSKAGVGLVPRQQTVFDNPLIPNWAAGTIPPEKLKKPYSRGNRPVTFDDNYSRGRNPAYDVIGGTDILNRMSLDADLQKALRESDVDQGQALIEDWVARNHPEVGSLNPTYGEGGGLYGWIDDKVENEDGVLEFANQVPDLPATHWLSKDIAKARAEVAAAQRAGEASREATAKASLESLEQSLPQAQRGYYKSQLYSDLSEMMRTLDPQHAEKQIPLFGQNTFNEMARYTLGRGRSEVNADQMYDILGRNFSGARAEGVPGAVNYTPEEALSALGLTGENATEVLASRLGVDDLENVSFSKKFVDDWARVADRGRMPPELGPLAQAYDDYAKRFKTLALIWPSRYSRDAYSGAFAAAMKNAFNPYDWAAGTRMRTGNYYGRGLFGLLPSVAERLAKAPGYEGLSQEEAVRKFLIGAGSQGLGTSTAADELLAGAGSANLREMYPGGAAPDTPTIGEVFKGAKLTDGWKPWKSDYWPFHLRTASGNRNPILEGGDRLAEFTDSGNRYGTYLNQIRKGVAPEEARRVTELTQVNYKPDAFTDFERDVMKRIFPFYSYTRGITPLIADQLVDNPAGLMGKSIRAISRASQPTEENFTPENLRQSASIPVPTGFPLVSLDPSSPLRRYLTNIDLPYESVINLFSPGVGNSLFDQAGDTLQKTALNILGQTNPLIKGPLELATNRQFYSNRQLSDLYSMLEQPLGSPGRVLEQVISNAPGGSRVLGTVRQVMDDRLDPASKASKFLVNALTGLKFQDVDVQRTKQLAARDMLNQLLEATPGVRTYENLTVPEEALRSMPKEQQDMYLLYKIIQSEAAKRAREKKKQQMAMDPMQMLGING